MILVTFHLRAVSRGAAAEFCDLPRRFIARRQEPGWIHGTCGVNAQDPLEVLVYEEWGSRAAWEAWRDSAVRADILRQARHLYEGELHYQIYEAL